MKRLHSALTVAAWLGAGMVAVQAQQRGGGPTPRQWWVAKAKPGQYGTNKPHIKLHDVKARHKGQSTWIEVVVNDENYHSEYHQGAPGMKISTVMHPDTREFYTVMEGQMRFTLDGQPEPIVCDTRSDHQHPEKDGVLGGGDRQRASAVGGCESAELQESLSRQRATAGPDARLHGHEGWAERHAGRVRGQQQTAFQPVRGGKRSEVQRAECGAGRPYVGTGDLGVREESAALRSERQGTLPRWNGRVVDHSRRTDPPQHRDCGGLHV